MPEACFQHDARRAGTQGPQAVRLPPWVPDISLTRNSGMTCRCSFKPKPL